MNINSPVEMLVGAHFSSQMQTNFFNEMSTKMPQSSQKTHYFRSFSKHQGSVSEVSQVSSYLSL